VKAFCWKYQKECVNVFMIFHSYYFQRQLSQFSTGYRLDSQQEHRSLIFATMLEVAQGSTKPPIQWVPEVLFLVKRDEI
jgi:hypothetical protein